jgi:hypothetical protein
VVWSLFYAASTARLDLVSFGADFEPPLLPAALATFVHRPWLLCTAKIKINIKIIK